MGRSGSGKSTLLRAVNGLNKVTRGKVMVRDGSGGEGGGMGGVASCDAGALRRGRMNRVAMVFPPFAQPPTATVAGAVRPGLALRGSCRDETQKRELQRAHGGDTSVDNATKYGGAPT